MAEGKDKRATASRASGSSAQPDGAAGPEQRGRRASPGFSQINANIPEDLKREFKARLALEGKTVQEVIEQLIRDFLAKR